VEEKGIEKVYGKKLSLGISYLFSFFPLDFSLVNQNTAKRRLII